MRKHERIKKKYIFLLLFIMVITVSTVAIPIKKAYAISPIINNLSVYAEVSPTVTPTIAPTEQSLLDKIISPFITGLGEALDGLFFSKDSGTSLDTLVYNKGNSVVGILEGKNDKLDSLRQFILEFYLVIRYIAITLFIPMGIYIGVYFARAGEDSQKKLQLKDKLFKFFITIIWLACMPTFVEAMYTINGVFVDIFYDFGSSSISPTTQGFLLDKFKELATNKDTRTIVTAFTYLASVFLNMWMLFFYFIRDLSTAFLFVIFPIFAVFYPYQSNMVVTWFKEMAGNIFTQAIHSGVLIFVLTMSTRLETNFINLCFMITAFAFVIPMTATIKRFLGLEGNIGGAKSMAGVGGLIGAMSMGGMALRTIKQTSGQFSEGREKLRELETQESNLFKTGQSTSSSTSSQLNPVRGSQFNSSQQLNNSPMEMQLEQIQSQKVAVKRDMIKGGLGTVGGAYLGAMTALGSSALGSRTAMMAGSGATMLGARGGQLIGHVGANAKNYASYQYDKFSKLYEGGEENYESNLAEYTGVSSELLDGVNESYPEDEGIRDTIARKIGSKKIDLGNAIGLQPTTRDLKGQLQRAEMTRKKYMAMGDSKKAEYEYSKALPQFSTNQEIEELKSANLYQDKEMSILYTEEADGSRKIHRVGEGDPTLQAPTTSSINTNTPENTIEANIQADLFEQATNKAYQVAKLDSSNTTLEEAERNPVFRQARTSEYTRLQQSLLQNQISVRVKLGVTGMTYQDRNIPQNNINDMNINNNTPNSNDKIDIDKAEFAKKIDSEIESLVGEHQELNDIYSPKGNSTIESTL